jgi:hypothetical protein
MKKTVLSVLMMAIFSFAFIACEKDEDVDPPVIAFENGTAEIAENATSALQVKILADKSVGVDYVITYTVSGTAVEGVNYEALSPQSVTMTAGETETVIFVTPINETTIGDDETLILTLQPGEDYTVAAESNKIDITILDNKFPPSDAPEVSFTTESFLTNPYLEEELEITMGISQAVGTELLIGIALDNAGLLAGTDYEIEGLNENMQLVLPANETSASFTVKLKNSHEPGVDKTMQFSFSDPLVTDYAIHSSANSVDINITDPVVDMSAWFNVDTEFNFFFASGTELAYRTDLPAYRLRRYYWNSETNDWAILTGQHHFYFADNDHNQWKDVINIYHKQIGWPGVNVDIQTRWEINGGIDLFGLNRFFSNLASYMRTYISSEDNGWIRFVTTDASAVEGMIVIPAQTIPVYKIKEGFDWNAGLRDDNNNLYRPWYEDSNQTQGKLWESNNVNAVNVEVEGGQGTYNSATGNIEFDVVFTVSDPDFSINPNFYINKDGDTYTIRIQYRPF